jgi:general secretion pathway protein H
MMREAGLTLVELLVALLVAGLLLAVVPSAMPRDGGRSAVARAAGDLATALKRTRAQAIAASEPAAFAFDRRDRSYEAGLGPRVALPPQIEVTMRAARSEMLGDIARVQFFPDGSSTGGRITVASGHSISHINIDWLTGRVAIER